jgi:hypothetical protein
MLKNQFGIGIFVPVANCPSPASAFCIRVSPVPLVTDNSGIAQL